MTRLEMLEKARKRAYELIDWNSALSDREYTLLRKEKSEDKAIDKLAKEFLEEALDDLENPY